MDKKAAMPVNQQYECIVQEQKENLLKRYCHENSYEKISQRSDSDVRSTIRYALLSETGHLFDEKALASLATNYRYFVEISCIMKFLFEEN